MEWYAGSISLEGDYLGSYYSVLCCLLLEIGKDASRWSRLAPRIEHDVRSFFLRSATTDGRRERTRLTVECLEQTKTCSVTPSKAASVLDRAAADPHHSILE